MPSIASGRPTIPLETFTTRPQPRSSMSGTSARERLIGANTLIANADCSSRGSVLSVGPSGQTTAALLIRISTPPSSRTTAAIACGTWSGSPRSAGATFATRPRARTSSAVSSSSSCERASNETFAPAWASATAVARPMPLPAPVTSACAQPGGLESPNIIGSRGSASSPGATGLGRSSPRSGCRSRSRERPQRRHGHAVPDEMRIGPGIALLALVDCDAAVVALDLDDHPPAPVDRGARELLADLRDLGRLPDAAPELVAPRVLADPHDRRIDARLGGRGTSGRPNRDRVVARLLVAGDLTQSHPDLVRRGVTPVPEAVPAVADNELRVEDEGERKEGPVRLVGELDQVELFGDEAILVRDEGEVGADPGAEGAVDVGRVDRDDCDPTVLALDLVLHGDEVAQPDLLLRAPPAAHERQHQRVVVGDQGEPARCPRVVRKAQVGERVAGHEIGSHRSFTTLVVVHAAMVA